MIIRGCSYLRWSPKVYSVSYRIYRCHFDKNLIVWYYIYTKINISWFWFKFFSIGLWCCKMGNFWLNFDFLGNCEGSLTRIVKEDTPTNLSSLYFGQPSLTNYHNNLRCTYCISGEQKNTITIRVIEFQIENDIDYLDIGEGHFPKNFRSFLVRITGKTKLKSVMSSTNEMWMFVATDDSRNSGGFILQLSSDYSECKHIRWHHIIIVNRSQLAEMKKSIPDMTMPWNL